MLFTLVLFLDQFWNSWLSLILFHFILIYVQAVLVPPYSLINNSLNEQHVEFIKDHAGVGFHLPGPSSIY